MKFLLVVIPAGVLLAGAFLYIVGSTPEGPEALAPKADHPPSGTTAASFDPDALLARVEALSADVERLTMEVTALRSERSRKPLAAVETAPEAVVAGAPVNREAIVKVLEEERERELLERRAEKEQKELDKLLSRAERVSRELALGPEGEKQLGDVLIAERQKRDAFIATVKGMERSKETGALIREGLGEIDAWRTQELGRHFGLDLAEQVDGMLDRRTERKVTFREEGKKDRKKSGE